MRLRSIGLDFKDAKIEKMIIGNEKRKTGFFHVSTTLVGAESFLDYTFVQNPLATQKETFSDKATMVGLPFSDQANTLI